MRTRALTWTLTGRRRRAAVTVAGAALLVTALVAPAQRGEAQPQASVRSASATTDVRIATATAAWTPSANASLSRVRRSTALQVKPRRASGHKTISMRSRASATAVDAAGSTVRATLRLRTSQPGRRLTLQVREVHDGRVVASRSASVRPSSRGWRTLAVTLRTTRAGSRIQLVARAERVRNRHVLAIASPQVGTSPVAAPPASSPTTKPSTPATGSTRCQDVDYSDPAQGVRTFTEDFDGTRLDPARWRVRDNTFLNQDQAWITKDAVSVHDGYLDIAGRRLPQDQWRTNANALYPENRVRDYSTGYVDTIDDATTDRFSQRYGTFQVRAWVPSAATMSRGIWPAFWLRADHQPGEIDPMESYGAPTIRSFDPSSSYEWNSWADTAQGSTSDPVKQKTQGRADVGADKIWQDWHVYGVTWTPSCLRYTYDGRTVGVVDFDDPRTLGYFRGPTFADTFHVRLNMQVGSKYWGWADPEHTRSSFSFKVDWVRVSQGRELVGR